MEVVHRSNLVPFFFQGSTCFWKRFSQKKNDWLPGNSRREDPIELSAFFKIQFQFFFSDREGK